MSEYWVCVEIEIWHLTPAELNCGESARSWRICTIVENSCRSPRPRLDLPFAPARPVPHLGCIIVLYSLAFIEELIFKRNDN